MLSEQDFAGLSGSCAFKCEYLSEDFHPATLIANAKLAVGPVTYRVSVHAGIFFFSFHENLPFQCLDFFSRRCTDPAERALVAS